MKIDLEDLEQKLRQAVQENRVFVAANSPEVTLALIARIRELEKAYREIMDDNFSELDTISERELLDKGVVLP